MLPDEERAAFFFALICRELHLQNTMDSDYTPIDCNLYDLFTEAAVLKKQLDLRIQTPGGDKFVTDRVEDVFTENHIEYILLAESGKHRLDTVHIFTGPV